jgi:hypothetical protein
MKQAGRGDVLRTKELATPFTAIAQALFDIAAAAAVASIAVVMTFIAARASRC